VDCVIQSLQPEQPSSNGLVSSGPERLPAEHDLLLLGQEGAGGSSNGAVKRDRNFKTRGVPSPEVRTSAVLSYQRSTVTVSVTLIFNEEHN
jgi:hypothetical protein